MKREHISPTPFTRILSVGRQLRRLQNEVYSVKFDSLAARMLGTTRVRITGVVMDSKTNQETFQVEPAEVRDSKDLSFCRPEELE